MRSWSVILLGEGDQSSLTMCRLNLNFKILGEILVYHGGGGHTLTMLGARGGQSSLTMCRLNMNFKILGEILVSHTVGGRGSIIFDHVQDYI